MLSGGRLPSSHSITGLASTCSIHPPGCSLLDDQVVKQDRGEDIADECLLVALFVHTIPLRLGKRPDHDSHVYQVERLTPGPLLQGVIDLENAIRWHPGYWGRKEIDSAYRC